MIVTLDGCQVDMDASQSTTIEDCLRQVEEGICRTGRVVTQILVDEHDIDVERVDLTRSLETVARLTVNSAEPKKLALEALQEAVKLLSVLVKSLGDVAMGLQQGKYGEALAQLPDQVEAMQWFLTVIRGARQVLGVNLSEPIAGRRPEELSTRLVDASGQMMEALENQDWVMLADALEYEVVPILEDWLLVVPAILQGLEV